jgi:hypothetical protein
LEANEYRLGPGSLFFFCPDQLLSNITHHSLSTAVTPLTKKKKKKKIVNQSLEFVQFPQSHPACAIRNSCGLLLLHHHRETPAASGTLPGYSPEERCFLDQLPCLRRPKICHSKTNSRTTNTDPETGGVFAELPAERCIGRRRHPRKQGGRENLAELKAAFRPMAPVTERGERG